MRDIVNKFYDAKRAAKRLRKEVRQLRAKLARFEQDSKAMVELNAHLSRELDKCRKKLLENAKRT